MKLPIQSENIIRHASVSLMMQPSIYPAQFLQVIQPFGGLRFCYGSDSLGRCRLYLGTRETCESLNPCLGFGGLF